MSNQGVEQVEKRQHADHARHTADHVNGAIVQNGQQHDQGSKNQDAPRVTHPHQLPHGLPGQHRAAGRETDIHQAHQHNRDHGAVDAELHPAGDHLRQAQLGPLRRMQRHDGAAQHLPDQQADQRPEHVPSQHHGQGSGDNRSDLQVGPEPQGELAEQTPVAL